MTSRFGKMQFTDEELARVPQTIERAEAGTQAEIFAVLTERSDTYRFVAYGFLALWIFLLSGVLALWWQWSVFGNPPNDWDTSFVSGISGLSLPVFVFAQIAAFVTGIITVRLFPVLAVKMTPGRIAHERAHANGVKQFLSRGIHTTSGRTGVLVFVSLNERYGEIFVDTAIEEAVGRAYFLEQVKVLIEHCEAGNVIDGYVSTIEAIGEKLSGEFPKLPDDENELENHFVIL